MTHPCSTTFIMSASRVVFCLRFGRVEESTSLHLLHFYFIAASLEFPKFFPKIDVTADCSTAKVCLGVRLKTRAAWGGGCLPIFTQTVLKLYVWCVHIRVLKIQESLENKVNCLMFSFLSPTSSAVAWFTQGLHVLLFLRVEGCNPKVLVQKKLHLNSVGLTFE